MVEGGTYQGRMVSIPLVVETDHCRLRNAQGGKFPGQPKLEGPWAPPEYSPASVQKRYRERNISIYKLLVGQVRSLLP